MPGRLTTDVPLCGLTRDLFQLRADRASRDVQLIVPLRVPRENLKRLTTVEAVRNEAALIQSKYPVGLQLLTKNDKGSVSIIHRDVVVLFHQSSNTLKAFQR